MKKFHVIKKRIDQRVLLSFSVLLGAAIIIGIALNKSNTSPWVQRYENIKYGFSFEYPYDQQISVFHAGNPDTWGMIDNNLSTTNSLAIQGDKQDSADDFPTAVMVTKNVFNLTPEEYDAKYPRTYAIRTEFKKIHNRNLILYYAIGVNGNPGILHVVLFDKDNIVMISPIDSNAAIAVKQQRYINNLVSSFAFR